MVLTMKKVIVLVAIAVALVAGLFGWTVRMAALQTVPQHHTSIDSSQIVDGPTWYCPAPPRMC